MKFKTYFRYLIIILLVYNLIPLLLKFVPQEYVMLPFVVSLLFINPIISLILSIIYYKKHGFDLIFSILIGLLFVPTAYILYNESALFYSVLYFTISFVYMLIMLTNKKEEKNS